MGIFGTFRPVDSVVPLDTESTYTFAPDGVELMEIFPRKAADAATGSSRSRTIRKTRGSGFFITVLP
jgi:hypothetical protein